MDFSEGNHLNYVIYKGERFYPDSGYLYNLDNGEVLDLSHKDIESITEIKGLENLINLEALILSDNQITEIKGLETLTNLEKLLLCNNRITEIKGLENLTSLRELILNGNQINEIKSLDTLTKLRKLNLRYNKITEIKGLDTLSTLKWLYINGNEFSEEYLHELRVQEKNNYLSLFDFRNSNKLDVFAKDFVEYCKINKKKVRK